MMPTIPAFRKHWLVLAATVALLAVALTAGTLFAANERRQPDLRPLSEQLPIDATDPGLPVDLPAPPAQAQPQPPQDEPGSGVSQVTSESDGSDALAQWLADRPEALGPFTVAEAMTADSQTVDWLLYQAVYKQVMTEAEAETFLAWYDQRPSSEVAPELLNHQPAYLDRPDNPDGIREMFEETESR